MSGHRIGCGDVGSAPEDRLRYYGQCEYSTQYLSMKEHIRRVATCKLSLLLFQSFDALTKRVERPRDMSILRIWFEVQGYGPLPLKKR